jgi:acyl-CoA thioester hydrolase
MKSAAGPAIPTPFVHDGFRVRAEWIDVNRHMNIAYYVLVFDQALDQAFPGMGFELERLKPINGSAFTAELHVTYQRELLEGDPIRVTTQLLEFDDKRCRFLQCLYHAGEGYLAATQEWLMLFVDLGTRRVAAMPDWLRQRLAAVRAAHAALPLPPVVGRSITLGNRRVAPG